MTAWRGHRLLLGALVLSACGLSEPDGEAPVEASLAGLTCRPIPVAAGPEDLVIDHAAGIAWISSTDRRALQAGDQGGRVGALSRLDLQREAPQAVDATPKQLRNPDFRPHGLGLLPGERPRLFVVDRRPTGPDEPACAVDNAVQIFEVDGERLTLIRTIEDPAMLVRLNDVEPIDGQRFFATNDHGPGSCLARNLRDLFGRNRGHLLLFDGDAFEVAAAGLPFANGLAFDRDARRLHVAASGDGTVRTFDLMDGTLQPAGRIALDRSPDNLSLGPDGELLIAAHPDRLRFMLYQRRWLGARTVPSSVLEVDPPVDGPVREIFSDDGKRMSAVSVAARYVWHERRLERLLLGQVYGDRLLLCDRPLAG